MGGRKVSKLRKYMGELHREVSKPLGSMEQDGVWACGEEGS